jgi:hypothetical protein
MDGHADRCDGCGLAVDGGTDGCQTLFDDESVREYGNVAFAGRSPPGCRYLRASTPSATADRRYRSPLHLTGVCIAVEHRPEEVLNDAVQRWLSRRPEPVKLALPAARGPLTIADVRRRPTPSTTGRSWSAGPRDVRLRGHPDRLLAMGPTGHYERTTS